MKKALIAAALALAAAPAFAQSGNNLEIVHHPNYDKSVFMPFSPASRSRAGRSCGSRGARRCRSITTIRTSASRSCSI